MEIRKQTLFYYFLVTLLLSSLSPLIINAQERSKIDSLKTLLSNSEDKDKLEILIEIGSIYNNISLDTALIYSQEGIQLAQELKLPKYEAGLLKDAAQTFFYKTDLEPALKNLFEALKIYESINDTLGQLNSLYGISICYSTRTQFKLAKEYAESGIKLAKNSKYKIKEAILFEQLGDMYIELEENFEKAIDYYNKSYELFKSSGNDMALSVTGINIGRMYTRIGNFSKAQKYLDEAYDISRKLEDKNRIYGALLALGENYFASGQYDKAKETLEKCFKQSRYSYEKWALLSLQTLAKVDSAQGMYLQAFNTFNQYHNFYDSLTNANSQEKLGELEAKYQTEKKQAQIDLLEKDNQIQTLWRNSFIGAFAFALILAVGLYNRYRFKNRTSKELAKLNNQLEGELKQAAEYIESLLPAKITGTIKTDWKFIPSAHLGGDSFGYGFLDENHFAIYLIDVSGHGVGAALLSTSILNILKSKSLRNADFSNPADVLNNLNQNFNMDEHDNKYFALWYGVINLSNKELVCASAFHPPAIAISNNSIAKYGNKEMMIGAFKDYNYENAYYQLSDNDSIFLFSDGCFEIETENKEFTFDDFTSLLKTASKENGKSLDYLHSLLASLKETKEFNDDFSIINVKLN